MRLLIFSMPAVAVVAILSVSLQHSMISRKDAEDQSALPEATRIFLKQTRGREFQKSKRAMALAQVQKRNADCWW